MFDCTSSLVNITTISSVRSCAIIAEMIVFRYCMSLSVRPRLFSSSTARGKSANPNLAKLDRVAQALKVERNWLIHGMGEVQGEAPIVEHPDDSFVAISSVAVRPSMGGGHLVEQEPVDGRPYHFQRLWIKHDLRADPLVSAGSRVVGP